MDISMWLEANKSLLQACAATATCVGVASTLVTHHLTKSVMKREFKRGNLRRVVEVLGVEPRYQDGRLLLDFTSNGEQQTLEKLLAGLHSLQEEIIDATKSMDDDIFLMLKNPESHRQMMEIIEDAITGLDPNANVAARAGRVVNHDGEYFAPTYHADSNGVKKVRIYVVNEKLISLIHAKSISMEPSKKRWDPMMAALRKIETRSRKSHLPGTGGESVVWHTVNKTSLDAASDNSSCLERLSRAA
jgi:hypothetical protein